MNIATLLENVVASYGGREACQTIELRRRSGTPADARLFFRDSAWLSSPAGAGLLEGLARIPAVATTRQSRSTVSLRFTDDLVFSLGKALEAGGAGILEVSDLLPERAYVVGFAGPNTNKALHVGHLCNIAIGHGLAAALETAGARVSRQSLVGDIGRSVCEAMAGFLSLHSEGDPLLEAVKPDHLVGRYYAEYVRQHDLEQPGAGSLDDPIAREIEITGDFADELMGRWLLGDPQVRGLWHQIRDMVMAGHRATLDRLGVKIDQFDYESVAIDAVPALMAEGLRKGILVRDQDGTVRYSSDRAEFSSMILIRNGDFPTEHARLLAVYYQMSTKRRPDCVYLDLAGNEWQPASALHMELMRKLLPAQERQSHIQLFHGMVSLNDDKMRSSTGEAILLDDLLDRVLESPRTRSVANIAAGAVKLNTVANMVVKGYFLCHPMAKPVDFSWNRLMEERSNPAWVLAHAWCRVMSDGHHGDTDSAPDNEAYRLLAIRSQDFRHALGHATRGFNLSGLTSYSLHLCNYFLTCQPEARLHGVMRTILGVALPSLGLIERAL
jgi:arginyl-tRNA synthetase